MSYKFTELVDPDSLRRLMELFHAATGIPVGIIDSDCRQVVATGLHDICSRYHHSHPGAVDRCRKGDGFQQALLARGEQVFYQCETGLSDVGVPIIIDGRHMATLYLGQFFYEGEHPGQEAFRRQAAELGADADEYLAALARIPVFTRQQVKSIMAYYAAFVGFLAEMGLARLRQAEAAQALSLSEEKYSKAFRTTPTIVSISTLAEGRFTEVNDTFVRAFGYPREDIIGHTSLELGIWQYPADRARLVSVLNSVGRASELEFTFVRRDGSIFIGSFSAEVIEIHGEASLLSIVNDITERKRFEERIETLNTDLAARAFQLESVNNELEAFNYTVSHDLRAPLTNIHGCSQTVLRLYGEKIDETSQRLLENIFTETERMEELINTLLEFSRLSQAEPNLFKTDLSLLVTEIANELQMRSPDRRMNLRITPGIIALCDAGLIRVALQNLVGNAWKYTAKTYEAMIEFGLEKCAEGTACFVRDNGPGFSMEHADLLFRPFQRLPGANDFAGSGIGLATVHRIIQRHGGKLWAESTSGAGATFYLILPELQSEESCE